MVLVDGVSMIGFGTLRIRRMGLQPRAREKDTYGWSSVFAFLTAQSSIQSQ